MKSVVWEYFKIEGDYKKSYKWISKEKELILNTISKEKELILNTNPVKSDIKNGDKHIIFYKQICAIEYLLNQNLPGWTLLFIHYPM